MEHGNDGYQPSKKVASTYRVSPFVSPLVESFGELGLWELEVSDVVDARVDERPNNFVLQKHI